VTTVADATCKMLADAGVERCYGIIGDALNPVIDALHHSGRVEFIHVRNEESGSFAAVAEAELTGTPPHLKPNPCSHRRRALAGARRSPPHSRVFAI